MEKVIFKNKEEFDIAEAKAYADFVKMARDAGYTIVRNNGKDEIIGKRLSDGVDMPDKKRITRYAKPTKDTEGKDVFSMRLEAEDVAPVKAHVKTEIVKLKARRKL